MRRAILALILSTLTISGFSQEKKPLNVIVNFSGALKEEKAGDYTTGNDQADYTTGFFCKSLRFEIKGDVTDKFYYRFRHRLNKSNKACNDNFAKATDIAYIGYHANDKLSMQVGKMTMIWGGYEYDERPYEVYQFSDMNEIIENYTPGFTVSWTPIKDQEFAAEVANSSCYTYEETYPYAVGDSTLSESKHPLTYLAGWYGSLFGGLITTRWAFGYVSTAKGKGSKAITLGQKLEKGKLKVCLDYMSSFDDVDRLGIVAQETNNSVYKNTRYNSFIARADYRFTYHWNAFVKGYYETSSAPDVEALKNYRKGTGYYAGIEYYPVRSQDLRFSLTYQGRHFAYSDASQAAYGFHNYNNNRFELGFMYFLKCL